MLILDVSHQSTICAINQITCIHIRFLLSFNSHWFTRVMLQCTMHSVFFIGHKVMTIVLMRRCILICDRSKPYIWLVDGCNYLKLWNPTHCNGICLYTRRVLMLCKGNTSNYPDLDWQATISFDLDNVEWTMSRKPNLRWFWRMEHRN